MGFLPPVACRVQQPSELPSFYVAPPLDPDQSARMFSKFLSSPVGSTNRNLSKLRKGQRHGDLGNSLDVAPSVSLHADPALGLTGRYMSDAGTLLKLDAKVRSDGDWMGLHIHLPVGDLQGQMTLGFACKGSAPSYTMVSPCIRSGTDEGFRDCFFEKHILFHDESTTHIDALAIGHQDDLPLFAKWRQIVLFLPVESFELTLEDFRVFLA